MLKIKKKGLKRERLLCLTASGVGIDNLNIYHDLVKLCCHRECVQLLPSFKLKTY